MRLAIIDCGTNTFNLLVIEVREGKALKKVCSSRTPVKLGEGCINKGYIGNEAFNRAVDTVNEFNKIISSEMVDKVFAYATSAIRDASNGMLFVEKVKQDFNINIEVINGDREAELIYLGIKEAVKFNESFSLIMDIGGGSTEFVLASNNGVVWKHSFNIGAARLLQRFNPSNPIKKEEMEAINCYLENQLNPLLEKAVQYPPANLVGSSGAFESLVEMIHGELEGEPLLASKTEYNVALKDYTQIANRVIATTLAERKNIKGLQAMRVDMIVVSCILINFVLKRLQLSEIKVSTYSLKEGALADYINKHHK